MTGYWQQTIAPDDRPALSGDLEVDVAVVGGGFIGLSTAHALRQVEPSTRVIVLEGGRVGDAGSEHDVGFAMTSFGIGMESATARFGKTNARRAHLFMERAVDNVGTLVREHRIECDYERTGLLTVACTPTKLSRLRHEVRLAEQLGLEGITWIDGPTLRELVNSPRCLGARYDARSALLHPAKLLRGLRARAEAAGAVVYEQSPLRVFTAGTTGKRHRLLTPSGVVKAERVVFATNAYHVQLPALSGKVLPVHSSTLLTEPLSDAQLATVGWRGRQAIEDGCNVRYRLTADNRLLIGGGIPGVDEQLYPSICALFPGLGGLRIAARWSGAMLTPQDMAYSVGFLGSERRVVYSLGAAGHDVAFLIQIGQLLAALAFDRPHPDRDLVFVNRRILPLPPDPIRFALQSTSPSYGSRPTAWR